jgi:ATP-binding cassette subfamily B protein
LAERSKGKLTVLVIAHRLSTVREADLVAVLKDGRIVETGTPAELRERGSIWAPTAAAHGWSKRSATPEVAL